MFKKNSFKKWVEIIVQEMVETIVQEMGLKNRSGNGSKKLFKKWVEKTIKKWVEKIEQKNGRFRFLLRMGETNLKKNEKEVENLEG